MALATRTDRRPSTTRTLWDSSVGKKSVMAVSGLIMLGYLVVHMLGNLKIFFGAEEFNGYAHWLRTLGSPFLHHEWALWIVRVVLLAAVVAHGVCAYQLSRRDIKARPVKYAHKRRRASYATRTMRWGGIILALFIVWHLLDLTTLTVNERAWAGHPYENVLATFSTWYGNTIYLVAMAALGLHVRHGFWSAAQTLGAGNARRDRTLKFLANALALVLFAGFVSVPVAVMTGVVS
ncbi:succinate dehydrogenase cytochrome b subunit [Streptomyces sp. NPDC002812]|uniref:succinate dehydrogenase cytochrome b subunit n=1 Tax=unclassified Streptomyces TaxID=2593676 RepID=UPI0020307135|nr:MULTISPECIES: succinate dehydrogenase cytochrome b subunit [unclassified Streptomyces]MCM1968153.1 succinate dehydrogenase cytochrome b subunit [Streptomyces sp. G1]MCX5130156.1 succinate dehydrogenase cytochrome b subunit [Streptomyces sp. NBC_00347]MCX5301194.1 succinate dehydrogenase cytochrome b subunit [Streptomyces sp. NBC_00193]